MQKTLTKISGLGGFDFEQVNLEDSTISFYVPLEIVSEEISGYVTKDYETFKGKYPQSRQSNYEIGLFVNFNNSKFDYDILVTYIDDDLEICEFTKILTDYGVTLSSETELKIKNLVLEKLKQEIIGE